MRDERGEMRDTRRSRGSFIATVLAAALVLLCIAAPAQGASGLWNRAWGQDVIQVGGPGDTGTGFEICTVAASCQAGTDTVPALGGELDSPQDIAVDAAGNVYVTDSGHSRVQKFSALGNFERAWGVDVVLSGPGETMSDLFEICVAANGDVCKDGNPNGVGGGFSLPSGVAVSGNFVFVTDFFHHRVQRFDLAGNFQEAWGENVDGTTPETGYETCTVSADCIQGDNTAPALGGELNSPTGIGTDTAGNVYVSDQEHDRIQKFSTAGVWDRAWGEDVDGVAPATGFERCTDAPDCKTGEDTAPALGGEMNGAADIAVDASGNVYVGDNFHDRVQRFDELGNFERLWGKDVIDPLSPGDTGTGFEVCVDPTNTCKIGDGPGGTGGGGELDTPGGIAVDATGRVYVAERDLARIEVFSPLGNFQEAWGRDVDSMTAAMGYEVCTVAANCQAGTQGGLGGELFQPQYLGTDAAGSLYVAEEGNDRVQLFADPVPPGVNPPVTTPPVTTPTTPPRPPKKCKKKKKKKSAGAAAKCKKRRKGK